MDWLEYFRTQYGYVEWSNNRVLEAAAALGEAELLKERDVPYGSIANDLSHIVRTQVWWLSVLEGNPNRPPELPQTDIIANLRRWYEDSHGALRRFLDSLTEEGLVQKVGATRPSGERYDWVRWHLLMHLANHSIQHRAEVGIAVASLGSSPGDIDFLDYLAHLGVETRP